MDRLTEPNTHGTDYYCWNYCPGKRYAECHARIDLTTCAEWEIYNRLAAYEETGLLPEEVAELKEHFDAHWFEIFKAEEQGRLIVLPCKVGDTVWFCFNEKVQSGTINRITTHTTRNDIFIALEVKFILPDPFYKDGRTTELRKFCSLVEHVAYERAYLTREEAEAALGGDGDG